MATNNAITVSDYMRKPDVIQRFSEVLGGDAQANSYVQSVLILCATDDNLRECTPVSIFKSALRAATLGLSCDPATKQAWLIPYRKNVGTRDNPKWVKEAQFQPHYLGLYNLAMRTGKYWVINVSPVYEGQRVMENPLTGLHAVMEANGFIGEPKAYNPAVTAFVDVTNRRSSQMKIIGWIGYMKTKKGNEKSVWMSLADIEDHAQKYVKNIKNNENWNDPDKRRTMEMKTVLRKLLSWADLSGSESSSLVEALQADALDSETVDAPAEDAPSPSEQDVEMTDPTSKEAVGYAAHEWNINEIDARKSIKKAFDSGALTSPMPKVNFKRWVADPKGEPQPTD